MASGKPDWNRIVTIQGKDGDDFRPILVDGAGQMYIALTGQRIDVGQENSDRKIKGKNGEDYYYVAVDASGVILSRMQGKYDATTQKDVKVDVNGNLISLMTGDDDGELRTVFVDGTGKMVARIQGVTGGNLVVFVLDDCGDTDLISNWSEAGDGLDPVESTTFVREGSKSMKLGIDASLPGSNLATWTNSEIIGDLTGLNNDKIKIWVYINTLDYLLAAGACLYYRIGSDVDNYIGRSFTKTNLVVGWNELVFDLSSPNMSLGTIDWSAIAIQILDVAAITDNVNDFYIIVDSIVIVRDNVAPGTLKDLNMDQDGFLLTRMVGSFGDYLKPLSCDRYGNSRVNPTQTDHKPLVTNYNSNSVLRCEISEDNTGVATTTLLTLAGPGVVLGGHIYHGAGASHRTCTHRIIIDGVTFAMDNFWVQDQRGLTVPHMDMLYMQKYDNTSFRYTNGITPNIYFNTSFIIQILEVVGNNNCRIRLWWASL